MANNYEQCTVEPSIPEQLVTELDLALLRGFGFNHEKDDDGTLYFFAEESVNNEFFGDIEWDVLEHDTSPLAKEIRAYLVKNGVEREGVLDGEISSEVVTWERVFQTILGKPENRGKKRITEIVAMAAYTCSKMRPGEFGGWCTRITRDTVQHNSTHGMLEGMRRAPMLAKALSIVCELAEGNALDANDVDASLLSQSRKQKRAIGTVQQFLKKSLEA